MFTILVLWLDIITTDALAPFDIGYVKWECSSLSWEWISTAEWYDLQIHGQVDLTLKRLGHFFQYVILFPNVVQQKCNIFIWNWSNKLNA